MTKRSMRLLKSERRILLGSDFYSRAGAEALNYKLNVTLNLFKGPFIGKDSYRSEIDAEKSSA